MSPCQPPVDDHRFLLLEVLQAGTAQQWCSLVTPVLKARCTEQGFGGAAAAARLRILPEFDMRLQILQSPCAAVRTAQPRPSLAWNQDD
jgi:hypothetical protein